MKIIYLGAEVPSNRTLLETTSATHVGFSYWRLVQRGLPKRGDYLLSNYFSNDFHIYVHPGIPQGKELDRLELESFAAEYEDFIAKNMDRLTTFNEINASWIDPTFVDEQRRTAWSEVPPGKFQPIWEPTTGYGALNEMADKYLDIAIPGDAIENDTQLATVTRTLTRQGTRFHILGSAKPDNLRSVSAESTTTLSWLSPMMNGETIIWDGMKLVRYPKRMKDQARSRYRNVYVKAGLNADKILEDDPKEVCRLAVWSYNKYEARLNGVSTDDELYIKSEWSEVEQSGDSTPAVSDKRPHEVRKLEPRNPAEMGNLPVFGYDYKEIVEDDGTIKEVGTINSQQVSLRMCDTCFVASNCPAFKPSSTCAFKLPVEVKTKEQLRSLLNAVIEMQGQRVAFMRFSEELNGGYADPNVSQEIDRLFKLIKTTKELDDSREFIRMTVERQGSAGVLSSIFGDKANVLKELPNDGLNEDQTTKIIKDLTEE